MDIIKTQNLTFKYPGTNNPALSGISFAVEQGEFVTVCGKSGCGKSTLLRQFKPLISPYGEKDGDIYFCEKEISALSQREQAEKIGFVSQSPDNQIVTDKVWHELAFGLESMGCAQNEIRARVAEMASFFGIGEWFHKNTDELSGGQKQILNLAAVMVMQPSILLLDEPTSQLDPIAAKDFIETLSRINREIGTTVVLSEHRLEEAFAVSDKVIVMDKGAIIADAPPREVGRILMQSEDDMCAALPTPMRVYFAASDGQPCPVTVREGKRWLEKKELNKNVVFLDAEKPVGETAIKLNDVWFRYEKNSHDILKELSLNIKKGEFYAITGGNGAGKTTLLSLLGSIQKPYRGKVVSNGKISILPQNPQVLFTNKTVKHELEEMSANFYETAELCEVNHLLDVHPFDLSGGEAQRVAFAKVLLTNPDILLLDEPTKGVDAYFKEKFADILSVLKDKGRTIIMVSHDIEFCAKYADRCGMLFDGTIVSEDTPRRFFSGKSFYTTAANRMARSALPEAVLAEDIILACGAGLPTKNKTEEKKNVPGKTVARQNKRKISAKNITLSVAFAILFLICHFAQIDRAGQWLNISLMAAEFIFLAIAITNLAAPEQISFEKNRGKVSWRNVVSVLTVLIIVPLTVYFGTRYLGGRKYYIISFLIIIETILPFMILFEQRKPKARELVLISVICALAVIGREAFFMLPQFKPIAAIVIISGVCFGAETGFLAGAISAFVSNFFFGQGVWTPWQMLALGMLGFLAGVFFHMGIVKLTKPALCLFGGLSVIVIYGGILNPASVLMWQENPTWEMILASYVAGISFDIPHALSTAFFLWVISVSMIEKLERIKIKYNLMK